MDSPAPPRLAFAKKSGVAVEDLKVLPTPKGDYLSATLVKAGQSASTVLAEHLSQGASLPLLGQKHVLAHR